MNSSSVTVRQHGVGLRCRPIGQQRSCCDDQLNPPCSPSRVHFQPPRYPGRRHPARLRRSMSREGLASTVPLVLTQFQRVDPKPPIRRAFPANRVINQMTDCAAADIARAEGLVRQVLAASPRSATVHFAKGEVLRAEKRYEEAVPEFEMVLALDRNSASALLALGHSKLMIGSIEELIPLVEQAMRLSP